MPALKLSEVERRRRMARCAEIVALCDDPAFPSDEQRTLARSALADAWSREPRVAHAPDLFEADAA